MWFTCRLERVDRDKHYSLLRTFVNYDRKSFFFICPCLLLQRADELRLSDGLPLFSELFEENNLAKLPGTVILKINLIATQTKSF